ncbi:MAG: RNA polymerase sigma factor [Clostridia bacterium]|nr:RNA polymerase sigma factor [Clostridia bacterium]
MTVLQHGGDAFRLAFETYTDTVYRVAVHNTRSVSDAEDVTQETFLRLLQCRKAFRDTEHLKAWLIRVTINLCKNHLRDTRREIPAEDVPAPLHAETDSVLDAVRALPENERNAVYLHYYEGYTAAEIASILSSRTNTVLSWLRRGRETLRETLGGLDNESL